MAKTVKYDATKMGPLSWRQLQLANQEAYANLDIDDDLRSALQQVTNNMSIPNSGSPEINWEGRVQSPIMRNSNGRDYWGKSMWDEQVADANDFYNNLSDLRGQNQPWYAQLGAGLLKGVTTFATTWLDGIVGLLYGAYKAGLSPDDKTGWDRAALLFHNSVSDSLQDFNEFMEEFAPNYKSRDEENNKWYQNMGTMNFWADGLIKNLGFTVGAFYSGSIFTKALKGIGGLIAAGKAGKAAKAYKAAKVKELMEAGMSAEEAAKAVNPMATAARYTNTLKAIEGARSGTGIAVAGSLFSAVNEGRIEANQVYRDAFTLGNTPEESKGAAAEILAARNRKMQEIEDDQTLLPSEKQALQAQVQANSQKLLAEAEQNAAKAGMLTLGLNIPILTIDNFKMYGRLYSRGFKQSVKQVSNNVTTQELKAAQDAVKNATTKQEKEAAKRALKEAERKAKAAHNARNNARIDDVAENVTEKEGRLAWNEITKGQAAWRGIKSGLMEGNEEMMQAWASGTAGNMTMPEDPDAYYKALTDPNATVKTNDFLTSVTKGFLDSYGNMDRWEEGAIGFLTGILGMPTFGARANSDSNTYLGRGKMIGLSGGFFGEFSNANYLNRLGAESVKNLNAFRDKYRQHAQFLAQSQAFTDAMDGYLQDKNEFAYNNARDNDDFAMIQALAVTGRIDEVKAMLNFKEEDLTDDILDSIANDFTENSNLVDSDGNPKTVDDNGKPLQGAWRDKAGNPMSKTDEGKAEMKAKLLEKQKRLNEEIDDYVASLDSVRAQVNNSLDESQVRELAWLDWKNKQWSRRFQDIQGTQEKAFDRLLEATEEALNAKTDEGGQYYTNEADSPIKREKLENLRDLLKEMKKAKSPREILSLLIKNTDTINSLFRKPEASEKEATLYDVISGWINDPVALADLAESLYDIRLMAIAQKQFSDKLDEYTSNPSKLAENRQRIEDERQETQSITDDINAVERVKNMSVSDMSKLSNEDLNGLASSISNLDEESTDKIKQRQEINSLSDTVKAKIQEREDLSGAEKVDLIALNEVQRQLSDSVDNYLNTETEALITASENLDENQTPNNTDILRDSLTAVREEKASGKSIENTNIVDPSTMLDSNETGHDPTSTVNTAQEARQEKEDKQKKEEEEKRSTEETNKIWDELIALAAEGKEAEMANKAHSIRSIIRKKIGEAVDKGDTPITEAQTGNYIVAAMRSQPYKDMEQLVSEENKSALLPTLRDVIAKYVQYYNSLLAERNATNTTNTASVIEEDPRTPDVTEDDLINYAESVKNNNNQREKRAEERDTWHPNTSHYGFGVSEFGTPKYDDETGLELKFYERVTGEKPEGHYSAKVRAKIETIAKWFEKKGVYDNIDTALGGRVKAGHKVVFTTSDELNKEVKEAVKKATGEDIEPVIILMAVEIDGALHIMGDLKSVIGIEDSGIIDTPLNNFSVAFNSAYGKWKAENKQGAFTFGETVIKQGMVGRMIFNNKTEFNTLNSVFGDKLHLGVALKDDKTEALDVITTPGKSKKNEKSAEEKSIRRPNNIKAGQPFVVIPSMISGASIAVPFVTPSLDEVMSRQDANELLIVQNIKGVLNRLALTDFDSMPEEELKNELLNIKDEIKSYINVDFFLSYDKKTHQIKFNGTKDDKRIGNFVINISVENEDTTERERRVINGILADFRKKVVGFQIDRNQINTGNYNKMIGEIAKINLPKNTPYHTSNDWFTVNKVTSTGKTVRGASVIPSLGSNPHAATSEVVVSTKQGQARVDINKKTVTLEDGTVITNLDTNERAKKIWAYGFGQGRKYFENKPTNKTAPYKTPVGWFDPVKTEFINEREAEKRTKNRSNTDNAVSTLIKSITDKYKGDLTFDVSEKSDGYPVVKITSNNEGDLYTYIFRVKDGNIESAAGWTSDNPANWEADNSVTNRGGDTISFTPVLDFYKTLGFTPKSTPTTTTQTTTEQQSNIDLANMSQNEYAEWLKVNGKPNGAESATFYDLLTARSRYRGENFNDRMKYYQDNIEALKALTAFLQEICSKFLNGTISVDGVKASSKGTGWNHFIINNDTKHSTETNKGYITLTQDSVLSLTENDIVDFLKAVQESGFNGQVKFPEIGSRMILAFDNFVIHGQTKEDVDKAMAVAEKFWGSKIEATQRGVDKNGTSHTDVLAKEVEEAIKNGKQPTTPQVSEQAPSTEITKEEREEILKKNSIPLSNSKYPSWDKNIGGYLGAANEGKFGKIDNKYDEWDSYYRAFDVQGDTAKFEFYGDEERAIANWSSVLSIVADWKGNYKTANAIYTLEAGEVKKNSDGRWIVTKKAKLQLVKKEDVVDNVYTNTEAVKRDIDSLQRSKNRKRQAWENQKREQEQEQKEEKQKVEEKQEAEQKPVENHEQLEKEAQDKLIEEAKAEQQKTPTDYVNGWIEELRNEGNSSAQLYSDMWEALGKRGWQEDAFEKTKKKGIPNKDKFIKMMNTIKANYDSTNKKDFTQKIDFKKARYRKTEDNDTKWNREQEMAWLKRALPQLSNEQRVQIVDGLIKVADSDNPGYAWGQFYRGLITISSEAASGTLYHEAFHAVIDLLMTEDEYNKLFDAAYQVWGNLGMLGLEEKLAEEFRKFVQYGDNAAFVDYDAEDIKTPIIRGIVRLFRRLKALIQGLRNKQIYLNKLFYDINKGKFADRKIKENILDKVTIRQEEDAQLVLDRNPELASVGTAREYAAYVNDIFPNSVEKDIYWHGSNEDFSDGFNTAKRGEGSGALETKKRNDLYLNRQGWASLQYVNGINRTGSDKNGFAHWNKLWWELKEIMSNGRRENNDWKDIVITDNDVNSIRQAIPNKKGKFDRDKGGTHGKWLKERKADYGYENKSDKEFFEEVFGLQLGKDTFNTWTARNAEVFKAMETTAKGIYPVVINVTNPIVEEGQNTYYEEQRGLFSQADRNGNDAILSRKADNEFNSDVAVVINANNKNVHWLGTKSDVEQFKQWKAKNVKQPKFDINERELEDIKKKAIADGTFMKAPNGKPTNLNERQWLQVRTKAFKDWFGDWENKGITVRKSEQTGVYDIHRYGEKIGHFSTGIGEYAGEIGYVTLDKYRGTGLGTNIYIALNRVLNESGVVAHSRPNEENSLHEYAQRIWEKLVRQGLAKEVADGYDMLVDNTYSKVVDENGEPLVVYHGGNADINRFTVYTDNSKMAEVFKGIPGFDAEKNKESFGAYFTADKSYAESYIKEDSGFYSVFLNIKNPQKNANTGNVNFDRLVEISKSGYDGLQSKDNIELVVFNPNQIKSATDNVGTFSRENNDIRYREVEQIDREMSVKQYHFQKLMYINLSKEDKEYIKERGMSVRDYSSMSQAEKELFWKCR